MDNLNSLDFGPIAPANRPLLGLTVMVVEDSRFACEALRLLCLRSGARIRRADCLKSARRHLQVYRPTVAIVDLGLPDGAGADLIQELATARPRVAVILGISGDLDGHEIAMDAGADGFLDKPITNVAHFQHQILTHLPEDRQPRQPRVVSHDEVSPDPIAYRDDMAHAADLLNSEDDNTVQLDYVTQFLAGVARSADDKPLSKAVSKLMDTQPDRQSLNAARQSLLGLVRERIGTRMAI